MAPCSRTLPGRYRGAGGGAVDEATTARPVYVGMTTRRADNTAVVSCDALDLDHYPVPSSSPRQVLAALWAGQRREGRPGRPARGAGGLGVAGHPGPRLASLDAHLRRNTPEDPVKELEWLASQRANVECHACPGLVTGRVVTAGAGSGTSASARLTWRRDGPSGRRGWPVIRLSRRARRPGARRAALGARRASSSSATWCAFLTPSPSTRRPGGAGALRRRGSRPAGTSGARSPNAWARRPPDGVRYRAWNAAMSGRGPLGA